MIDGWEPKLERPPVNPDSPSVGLNNSVQPEFLDLTAQSAAALSAAHLPTLIKFTPVIIYTSKTAGDYGALYVSENVTPQLGYSPAQFIDEPNFWLKHIHPDDQARVLACTAQLLVEGQIKYEYRFQLANGSYHWMLDEAQLVRDVDGHPVTLIGYWLDINDRKEVEMKLYENELQLEMIFRVTPAIIGISTLTDGRYLKVNETFLHTTGYSREEIIGQRALDIGLYADPNDSTQLRQILRERGWVHNVEVTLRGKNGQRIYCVLSSQTIEYRGQLCLLTVANDITKRKQTEQELQKREWELKEAQRVGQLGSWDWDATTDTITWSEEYYRIYGFDPSQPPPGYQEHLKVYTPHSAAQLDAAVNKSMETGEPYEIDLEYTDRTGARRWVTARGEIKRDANNRIIGLRGTAQDITDRKRAEEALQRSNLELKARNEELDAFSHTVAHDLKNPVHLLMGNAEILAEAGEVMAPEDRQQALESIARNGRKLGNIIDELLLLAGLRQAEVKIDPLDMKAIVMESLNRLMHLAENAQAEIIIQDAIPWPTALGHQGWVEEIWANYISNALAYGGKPPHIEIGADAPIDDMVRFWVHDNGRGLTPEEQERLFIPFTRLDQIRARGHGLGLSIVRRIVEKLNGQVGVESSIGQGSTFYFTLPLAKIDQT